MRLRALTALVLTLGSLTVVTPASAADTVTVFYDGRHSGGRVCGLASSDQGSPGMQNGVVDGGPTAVPGGDPSRPATLVCSVQLGTNSQHYEPHAVRVESPSSSGVVHLAPTSVSYDVWGDLDVWVCTEVRISGWYTLYWDDSTESWTTDSSASCALAINATTPGAGAGPVECGDGIDNDGDGRADYPADPDCLHSLDPSEAPPPVRAACEDGADNDGDGRTDYPADPDCTDAQDQAEHRVPPGGLTECDDGVDNDGDGWTDHPADPGCAQSNGLSEREPSPSCPSVAGVVACASYTSGTVYETFRVMRPTDLPAHVAAHVYLYDVTLPNSGVVSLPCLVVGGPTTVDPCAQAGGVRRTLVATLVDDTLPVPGGPLDTQVAYVTVCHANLVLTVNGIGVKTFPAYALCGSGLG